MLLIRPFIRTNKIRISAYHIVFFIFLISNISGLLTPIGSPPLFIGYLKGIPFFWVTSKLFFPWVIVVSLLMGIFYIIDRRNFKKQKDTIEEPGIRSHGKIDIRGYLHIILRGIVLISVFITRPVFLREIIMLAAALVSYKTTKKEIHGKK